MVVQTAAAIGSGGGMKRRGGGGSCRLEGWHRRQKAAEAAVRKGEAATRLWRLMGWWVDGMAVMAVW